MIKIRISISLILVGFILPMLYTSCTNKENSQYKLIDIMTSERIEIFDGRTGDIVLVDRSDYIDRIITAVEKTRYSNMIAEGEVPAGSSYNIFFLDEDDNILSTISFAWPEDIVYINNLGYEIVDEDKYLLYALAADYLYLITWEIVN